MTPLDRFDADIARVRVLLETADHFDGDSNWTAETSDIRRGALAMAVSALDNFVHRRVHDAFLRAYLTGRLATNSGQDFPVRLAVIESAANDPTLSWLSAEITQRHGYKVFQKPGDISAAVSLVRDAKALWSAIAAEAGTTESSIRTRLSLIVDRRNQIVHESDSDPSNPSALWPIATADVAEGVETITAVARGVEAYLSEGEEPSLSEPVGSVTRDST